jgi:hypothetical protein
VAGVQEEEEEEEEEEEDEEEADVEERGTEFLLDTEEDGPLVMAKDNSEIRGWNDLREQIKEDLRMAKKRNMTLTQINQLIVLRNFATLRIKGIKRIAASQQIAAQWHEGQGVHFARQIRTLARHYQRFEQLPPEKRGGKGRQSLFNDEGVQRAARAYLTGLHIGDVTPMKFRHALNEQILPTLGYVLEVGLSERTARRWLYKLGWRRTRLKKGVYMDGHERDNVREYRDNIFLCNMASFERRMVRWEFKDSKLVRVEPQLGPGEKRVIAVFQDESSFHANEYKQNIWCAPK